MANKAYRTLRRTGGARGSGLVKSGYHISKTGLVVENMGRRAPNKRKGG